jgi:hypothetical protein
MHNKKKQITLTLQEWTSILGWCETYYHEYLTEEGTQEREQEEKYEELFYNSVKKLKKKIYNEN